MFDDLEANAMSLKSERRVPEAIVKRRHRVEHVPLLSDTNFWWMMAVVIILVTVVVIRTLMAWWQ